MRTRKNKWQLKFCLDTMSRQYHSVILHFKLGNKIINGVLTGTAEDWVFSSGSAGFLKYVPKGRLSNYAFWADGVPPMVTELYRKIDEAALKAGYDICEKEESTELHLW